MLVSANTTTGYVMVPRYGELSLFLNLFKGLVKPMDGGEGWTFISYDTIPEFLIKDQVFMEKTVLATTSFDTKTKALHSLKLGMEVSSGKPINVEQGLVTTGRTLHRTRLGLTANHIPQIYGIYPVSSEPKRILKAFSGDYDLNTRIFTGHMDFTNLEALWKE